MGRLQKCAFWLGLGYSHIAAHSASIAEILTTTALIDDVGPTFITRVRGIA